MRYLQRLFNALSWRSSPNIWTMLTVLVCALVVGLALATLGQLSSALLLAFPVLLIVLMLLAVRAYLLLSAITVGCAIFIDFYQFVGLPLHEPVVALALAVVVLAVIFFTQSGAHPWVPLRHLLWWVLLLGVAALAIPRGGSLTQTVSYYVTIFGTSFVMYCLGAQVTRDYRGLRLLLILLMLISAFIALHTIIEGATGRFLFATSHESNYLSSAYDFHLSGSSATRAGSFLLNPDWNGVYLAFSLFIAAGILLTETASRSSRLMRLTAAASCVLVLVALLFTFTTASWLAAGVGLIIFIGVFAPRRYRWWTFGSVVSAALLIGGLFHRQVSLLISHATSGGDAKIRVGAWETALHIIARFPLTGIGMGYYLYIARSPAYRAPLQTEILAHPNNSYLELAAFAGLPVLLAFLIVLALAFRDAIRAYRATEARYKPLVGGVITALVVLSVNSLFINGWTIAPFACLGWLLLGAVTSRAMLATQKAAQIADAPVGPVDPVDPVEHIEANDSAQWAPGTPAPQMGGAYSAYAIARPHEIRGRRARLSEDEPEGVD